MQFNEETDQNLELPINQLYDYLLKDYNEKIELINRLILKNLHLKLSVSYDNGQYSIIDNDNDNKQWSYRNLVDKIFLTIVFGRIRKTLSQTYVLIMNSISYSHQKICSKCEKIEKHELKIEIPYNIDFVDLAKELDYPEHQKLTFKFGDFWSKFRNEGYKRMIDSEIVDLLKSFCDKKNLDSYYLYSLKEHAKNNKIDLIEHINICESHGIKPIFSKTPEEDYESDGSESDGSESEIESLP
jgi:hypothetical protein